MRVFWGVVGASQTPITCNCAANLPGESVSMMENGVFGLYVMQFLLFVVGFWGYNRLSQLLDDSRERLNGLAGSAAVDLDPVIGKIETTIAEIVDDTLQNLEPPRAIDHVFGAVAQMIQMRTMRAMDMLPQGVQDLIEPEENV